MKLVLAAVVFIQSEVVQISSDALVEQVQPYFCRKTLRPLLKHLENETEVSERRGLQQQPGFQHAAGDGSLELN